MGLFDLQLTEKESPQTLFDEDNKPRIRKSKAYDFLSRKFEYRRAFCESALLDALAAPGFEFKKGHVYNFITAGDIDSLSYLKAIIRQQELDYVLCSTSCMAAQDIIQFRDWVTEGKIKKMDFYVGEIFQGSYSMEYALLVELYEKFPNLGRIATFRNHSKVFAGTGKKFSFGIQSSANINTNPRTEQASITIDEGIYQFYKDYYDGIKSF